MSEREKLILETKKEIRSILLSTKAGVELTRLNKEYEMFTGAKINYRGMGYTSIRAFVDDIPDVARQYDDGYGTITLTGVADESTRHIASLVSRQRGKKKSFRGRHFPGPRLGLLSNLPMPRSSYASKSFAESHSHSYASRFGRTITRTNPGTSPIAGKLRSSVSDQKSAAVPRPVLARQPSKDIVREAVVPALRTMDPGIRTAVPSLLTMDTGVKPVVSGMKTMDPGMKSAVPGMKTAVPVMKTMDQGMKSAVGMKTMDPDMKTVGPGMKTMDPGVKTVVPGVGTIVPELQRSVPHTKMFVSSGNPNLRQMLSFLLEGRSGSIIYSSFKKSFEKEFGLKLDLAEFGYSSVSEMFSHLGIPVRVKPFCSDDYTILPGPMPTASDIEKGEKLQRNLDAHSIPLFSLERPPASAAAAATAAAAAQSALPHPSEGPPLSAPNAGPQQPVHSQEGAPHIQYPPMPSRPSSRRMSLVSRCSRTAPVSDKPKIPSTPSVSQELRDAIAQVLKNSPDGILIGGLEKKLKEMTGVEINIEETGARSLEHLLVNFPEIVLMQYRGHGQLLLFDPGQTAIKESIEQRRKDTPPTDVDCSSGGRRPEHQATGQMYHEPRPKPRDLPDDSVGPKQVIATLQLPVGANEYLPIYVSSVVSPGHFWFQIDGEQYGRLVDLMEMLQSTYNHPQGCQYEMPSSLMKIGQLCAAKFPEDSNWHRGTIMGFKESLVQIYYLDYGTTSFVTKDLLRILRSQYLTLPAQAIRARLANVQPTNGEWSEAAYTFFMERFTNKRLMALITSVTRDGLVSVSLTDTNGEKDVQLNDCLVVDGYAVFQVDDYAVGRPEVPASKKVDKSTSFSDLKSVEVKPSATGDADDAILITEQDIKFVQLPPNYGCHMVRISDKLYIISNEISAFLWEENVLRTMVTGARIFGETSVHMSRGGLIQDILTSHVRQKGYGYLPKLVLRIQDHLAVMEELAKFNIPGVFVNGEFAEILVLYELSIVIQILEIFEHKSDELKSELKKHLESFSANPAKWTAFTVPSCAGDEDCATVMSDDLATRSAPSRCNIETSNGEDAKEGKELQKEWKLISEQRKKLLSHMRNSPSPKTSAFAVEELSRMEGQMKVLEDRYDAIQKCLGVTDAGCNAKINNNNVVTASIAYAVAEKIRGLASTPSLATQKKPRTNCVAPMTQTGTAAASAADIRRDSTAPVSQASAGHHRPSSVSLPLGGVGQPGVGFPQSVRPGMEYGQQMDNLAQMLQQMTIRNQAPLTSPVGLLGLAGLGYQLPTPPLHTPFGYSAAQILMQQQQSYFAALQGLSSLVSNGAAFPQTPYDSSLLGITNLSYLANAAPSGSAMPRTTQQGPRQN